MECRKCRYCYKDCYEDSQWECNFFGNKIPEEFDNGNDGCCLHYKEKQKLADLDNSEYHKYLNNLREKYGKKEANNNSNGNNI